MSELLSSAVLRRLGALFALAVASCVAQTQTTPESDEEVLQIAEELRNLDTEEAAFLATLNNYRAQNGLPKLVATPLLNQVAYNHSLDMGTNNYFSHTNLKGQSPFDRMKAAGYNGGYMAENIAAGYGSAADTFNQWKNSAGHNANMLGAQYKAIGIGRAYVSSSPYRYYWTTNFGDVIDSSYNPGGGGSGGSGGSGGGGTGGSAGGGTAGSGMGGAAGGGTAGAGGSGGTTFTCTGTAEVEPNNTVGTPNALAGTVCAQLSPTTDLDWYNFSMTQSGMYEVSIAATADAKLTVYKLINGVYYTVVQSNPTKLSAYSSSGGKYFVKISTPAKATQRYKLALKK